MNHSSKLRAILAIAGMLLLCSCASLYYASMEKLGKEKRDILIKRIVEGKKDQEAAKEEVKTTLERFQELTGFKGGNLEKNYKKLNGAYEQSQDRANKLQQRIASIDQVAKDLFQEWDKEISSMRDAKLRAQSNTLLRNARARHSVYIEKMRQTRARLTPVLQFFHDQVIYLKHNLNARAIQSLKGTSAKIDLQATNLIRDIDASSREADRFIQSLATE